MTPPDDAWESSPSEYAESDDAPVSVRVARTPDEVRRSRVGWLTAGLAGWRLVVARWAVEAVAHLAVVAIASALIVVVCLVLKAVWE